MNKAILYVLTEGGPYSEPYREESIISLGLEDNLNLSGTHATFKISKISSDAIELVSDSKDKEDDENGPVNNFKLKLGENKSVYMPHCLDGLSWSITLYKVVDEHLISAKMLEDELVVIQTEHKRIELAFLRDYAHRIFKDQEDEAQKILSSFGFDCVEDADSETLMKLMFKLDPKK